MLSRRTTTIVVLCLAPLSLLAGCGGDGSGGPLPISASPPPLPPPPPPPPPPPAPGSPFDTAEYERSNGAVTANAIVAYQDGVSGAGVKIAIIDGGINPNLSEFAGRIDPASRDIVANRTIADGRHATAVTAIAAAAKNDSGIQGLAYDATIIALRADADCGAPPCGFTPVDLSAAIDAAVVAGARVINMSVGGPGGTDVFLNAIDRATKAGVVIVLAAGNDGAPQPDGTALISAQHSGSLVIIAGAHDANRTIASFSDRAGPGADFYITALGQGVNTIDENGQPVSLSGTSVSTPIVSGAVALLASAFPNLSGAQIVSILYQSADDAGAPGVDPIYGHGILNLQRAFAPIGALSLPGTNVALRSLAAARTSGPMGDADRSSVLTVALDSFGRAFQAELKGSASSAPQERPLAAGLQPNQRVANLARGPLAVSMTFSDPFVGRHRHAFDPVDLSSGNNVPKLASSSAIGRIGSGTTLGFGLSQTGRELERQLRAAGNDYFLAARDPMDRRGFYGRATRSFSVRQQFTSAGLTFAQESGRVVEEDAFQSAMTVEKYRLASASFNKKFKVVDVSVGVSRVDEEKTVLGARFSNLFAGRGARTSFADGEVSYSLGSAWTAVGSYRRGWTSIPATGIFGKGGHLSADAWSFEISKERALHSSGSLAFRLAQPLRISSGGIRLNLPISYDYSTRSANVGERVLNLAPAGRELDLEAVYSVRVFGGLLTANSFARRQPGNVATAHIDVGAAMRFSIR